MAFEGNIEDFGVADVLQLINSQAKTGVLTFHIKREIISIGFENGMISSASHNKKGVLKPIGDYLVLTGKISKVDLKKCKSISKKKGISIVDTLVENGVLTKEDLEKLIEFKIQEIVDELFTWEKGEYKFQLGEKLYSKSTYSVLVNPQFLILEGMRRIDEWPKIKEAIPDAKAIFKKKKRPSLSIEMGEQENVVLKLMDAKKGVADIVEASGLGRFRTYHAIYNLLDGGVIERTEFVVKQKIRKRSFEISRQATMNIVVWVILMLFVTVNIILAFVIRPFYKRNYSNYRSKSEYLERYKNREIDELKEVYRIIKGKKVKSVGQLREEGWLTD